jgi:transcriptional regulator with XRE-family HTH domain
MGDNRARTPDLEVKIGAWIKTRREQLGIFQSELAMAVGISQQALQKYEKGRARVAASTLLMIAQELRVDLSYETYRDVARKLRAEKSGGRK